MESATKSCPLEAGQSEYRQSHPSHVGDEPGSPNQRYGCQKLIRSENQVRSVQLADPFENGLVGPRGKCQQGRTSQEIPPQCRGNSPLGNNPAQGKHAFVDENQQSDY